MLTSIGGTTEDDYRLEDIRQTDDIRRNGEHAEQRWQWCASHTTADRSPAGGRRPRNAHRVGARAQHWRQKREQIAGNQSERYRQVLEGSLPGVLRLFQSHVLDHIPAHLGAGHGRHLALRPAQRPLCPRSRDSDSDPRQRNIKYSALEHSV